MSSTFFFSKPLLADNAGSHVGLTRGNSIRVETGNYTCLAQRARYVKSTSLRASVNRRSPLLLR